MHLLQVEAGSVGRACYDGMQELPNRSMTPRGRFWRCACEQIQQFTLSEPLWLMPSGNATVNTRECREAVARGLTSMKSLVSQLWPVLRHFCSSCCGRILGTPIRVLQHQNRQSQGASLLQLRWPRCQNSRRGHRE